MLSGIAHAAVKAAALWAACVVCAGACCGAEAETGALIEALGDDARQDVARDRLLDRGAEAVAPLREALGHENWKVRVGAAVTLGRLGAKEAAGDLAAGLGDRESGVRVACAFALAEIADPSTLGPLLRATGHEDEETRAASAFALGHVKGPGVLERLLELAGDRSAHVRAWSAAGLGVLGDSSAAGVLAWMVGEDDDPESRALAANALADLSAAGAAGALADALADEETVVQSCAVRSLRTLTSKNFHFDPHGDEDEKAAAAAKWRAFVAEHKDTFATIKPVAPAKRVRAAAETGDAVEEAPAPPAVSPGDDVDIGEESEAAGEAFEIPELGEGDARGRYRLAAAAHKEGNIAEASRLYKEAIELDADFAEAHAGLGQCLLQAGLIDGAVKELARGAELAPSKAHYHAHVARALEQGRKPGALDAARRAFDLLDEYEDTTSLYVCRVALSVALDRDDLAFAAKVADAIGEAGPRTVPGEYGRFLLAAGLERSALGTLLAAREAGGLDDRGLADLASCLVKSTGKAEGIRLALGLRERSAMGSAECARVLSEAGAEAEAAVIVLGASGDERDAVLSRPLRDVIAELRALEFVREARQSVEMGRTASALVLQGNALAEVGELEGAREAWEQALSADPLAEAAAAGLARCAIARDDAGGAVAVLSSALERAPRRNARLLAQLAEAHLVLGNHGEAAQAAAEALGEALSAGPLYELAAQAWTGKGDLSKAHAMLREYAKERPGPRSFAALARFLATSEDAALRDEEEARYFAELAADSRDVDALCDVAEAFRILGDDEKADELATRAEALSRPVTVGEALSNAGG